MAKFIVEFKAQVEVEGDYFDPAGPNGEHGLDAGQLIGASFTPHLMNNNGNVDAQADQTCYGDLVVRAVAFREPVLVSRQD